MQNYRRMKLKSYLYWEMSGKYWGKDGGNMHKWFSWGKWIEWKAVWVSTESGLKEK